MMSNSSYGPMLEGLALVAFLEYNQRTQQQAAYQMQQQAAGDWQRYLQQRMPLWRPIGECRRDGPCVFAARARDCYLLANDALTVDFEDNTGEVIAYWQPPAKKRMIARYHELLLAQIKKGYVSELEGTLSTDSQQRLFIFNPNVLLVSAGPVPLTRDTGSIPPSQGELP